MVVGGCLAFCFLCELLMVLSDFLMAFELEKTMVGFTSSNPFG